MDRFLQQVADGIVNGSIYALVALALVLIHRTTGLVNFAQGELAMLSTYVAWSLLDSGASMPVAVAVTLAASFAGGALIERVLIRPVESSSPLAIVMITIGLFISVNSLAAWIWTPIGRPLRPLFGFGGDVFELPAGVRLNGQELTIVAILLVVAGALYVFFRLTRIGLLMRAASSNPTSSRLAGVNVGRLLMLGWGLAATMGALAGILVAPKLTLSPSLMLIVLIYGFAAATLGGFDSPLGAVVGGIAVGLAESLAATYVAFVGSDLKLAVAFALILVVLLVRPAGLFGSRTVHRA